MHGATQGSLNPGPTRSRSRPNTSELGGVGRFWGMTLSGMSPARCAKRRPVARHQADRGANPKGTKWCFHV
jgi:hypothetical protein